MHAGRQASQKHFHTIYTKAQAAANCSLRPVCGSLQGVTRRIAPDSYCFAYSFGVMPTFFLKKV